MTSLDTALTPGDLTLELDEPDLARGVFGRLYDVGNIDVSPEPGGEFAWNWRISPRGAATLIRGHSRAGSVTVAGVPPFYVLVLVEAGNVKLTSGGHHASVVPNVSGAMVNANTEVSTSMCPGTRTINVRIDQAALVSHLSALVGTPVTTPLSFEAPIDLRSEHGADVLRLAQVLADAVARPDTPLGSPHVIAHLREALFGLLLTGQKSTTSHFFQKAAQRVNPRAVKLAEEILDARAADPISIAEVARLVGISLRSLERSYKEARGRTLRDFLKMRRLELAHRRLVTAAPGATVTQVLYASGFSHPGEFSRAYRERFGTSPSETLRRALNNEVVLIS